MQRIANPSTPVRFRPEPPFFSHDYFEALALRCEALSHCIVVVAFKRIDCSPEIAPFESFCRVRERWDLNKRGLASPDPVAS